MRNHGLRAHTYSREGRRGEGSTGCNIMHDACPSQVSPIKRYIYIFINNSPRFRSEESDWWAKWFMDNLGCVMPMSGNPSELFNFQSTQRLGFNTKRRKTTPIKPS